MSNALKPEDRVAKPQSAPRTYWNTPPETVEHGIESACYEGMWPTITCLCGWCSGPRESWEAAGSEFDAHLATGRRN